MATTIRNQWLDALKNKIALEIPNVRFSVPNYVPADLPACTLWDDTDDASKDEYGYQQIETEVMVEVFEAAVWGDGSVFSGEAVVSDQYAQIKAQGQDILGRVVGAVTGGDTTLGGLCEDIEYTSGAVQYPDDGDDQISAGGRFRIRWSHRIGNPYEQDTL